ncbi:hypothetical protein BB934_44520 (plasmid) [Microvirga ossetica]|uniref:Uncharacterized protein n=1 Tax=Microvirga ossetica TaxID=1882682 RepID=A0A1B2EZ34_9HYPH|nr:hypothetical protein BB934_44520 [Microvirga ossetica]
MRIEGRRAVNSLELARSVAHQGFGLVYLPEDFVEEQIAKKRVMQGWKISANLSPATNSIPE